MIKLGVVEFLNTRVNCLGVKPRAVRLDAVNSLIAVDSDGIE